MEYQDSGGVILPLLLSMEYQDSGGVILPFPTLLVTFILSVVNLVLLFVVLIFLYPVFLVFLCASRGRSPPSLLTSYFYSFCSQFSSFVCSLNISVPSISSISLCFKGKESPILVDQSLLFFL